MNLVGYTATALSRNDIEDTPTNKNVVDFAIVELKDLNGDLVVIYDDATGLNPETQKTCDNNGQVTFFAEIGDYDLEINGKAQRINLSSGINDTTSSDVAMGKYKVGRVLTLIDRDYAKFQIFSGGSINGYNIIDAGGGNTAHLIPVGGSVNMLNLGVEDGEDASDAVESASYVLGVSEIKIPNNQLWLNSISINGNTHVNGLGAGSLMMGSDLEGIAISSTSKSWVAISGLSFMTTKETPSGGLQRFIQLNDCDESRLYNLDFYNCKNQPITLDGCRNSFVDKIYSDRSYGVAITLRNGCDGATISNCNLENNGYFDDGITGPFGRGLLIWQSRNITVDNVNINKSSEYGLRIYSEGGDTLGSENITLSNINIEDAEKINFYIYNESGLLRDITVSNLNIQAGISGSNAVSLAGENITISGGTWRSKTPQTLTAIVLFNGDNISIDNIKLSDFSRVVSYGSSEPVTNTKITNMKASGILRVTNGFSGAGHIICDSEFEFHSSTTEFAIGLGSDGCTIDNNVFDGAYRVFEFSDSPSTITNNTSKNTIDVSTRKYGTLLDGMSIYGNAWDKASNPAEFSRISELNRNGLNSHCVLVTNSIPSALVYPERSIAYCYNNSNLSTHIGWTQTSTGVWKTFGAITP